MPKHQYCLAVFGTYLLLTSPAPFRDYHNIMQCALKPIISPKSDWLKIIGLFSGSQMTI